VVAVVPTPFFEADAESARNVTRALAEEFRARGYTVVPMDRAEAAFQRLGLDAKQGFSDAMALRFGRSLGADLVAYPRLLSVGLPASRRITEEEQPNPAATVLLRVLNVHSGAAIYARQIRRSFPGDRSPGGEFHLAPSDARAVVAEVTQGYFQRVAGSRQEYHRPR
jgi:hypothetical protein